MADILAQDILFDYHNVSNFFLDQYILSGQEYFQRPSVMVHNLADKEFSFDTVFCFFG